MCYWFERGKNPANCERHSDSAAFLRDSHGGHHSGIVAVLYLRSATRWKKTYTLTTLKQYVTSVERGKELAEY